MAEPLRLLLYEPCFIRDFWAVRLVGTGGFGSNQSWILRQANADRPDGGLLTYDFRARVTPHTLSS